MLVNSILTVKDFLLSYEWWIHTLFSIFMVLGIRLRTLNILNKHSTTELYSQLNMGLKTINIQYVESSVTGQVK